MTEQLNLYSDGGSRHNPGPAAGAYVLYNDSGKILEKRGVFLGVATNNAAEYYALELGLAAAKRFHPQKVVCHLDSELAVRQLNGIYRIKDSRIRERVSAVRALADGFAVVEYRHVPRERNREADKLVNRALDDHLK